MLVTIPFHRLYNPVEVLSALAHETSHYVGEHHRKRAFRTVCFAKAAAVLLGKLPEGIRPGELCWEALAWERETGMFLRRGRLRCRALFTAESREDGGEFLDFILKGVVRN